MCVGNEPMFVFGTAFVAENFFAFVFVGTRFLNFILAGDRYANFPNYVFPRAPLPVLGRFRTDRRVAFAMV